MSPVDTLGSAPCVTTARKDGFLKRRRIDGKVQPAGRDRDGPPASRSEDKVDRAQKRELVGTLNETWKGIGAVVVAHYTGMTVAEMTEYRKRMKAAGGAVKVAKNRLAKLSLQGTSAEAIADLLKGQTCIAYSGDPISAAKVSVKYAKENNKLVILGGAMGSAVLDTKAVQALADLPSLDELRATLIGLLQAPATKIARVLKEPGAQLARVLHAQSAKAA